MSPITVTIFHGDGTDPEELTTTWARALALIAFHTDIELIHVGCRRLGSDGVSVSPGPYVHIIRAGPYVHPIRAMRGVRP